MGLNDPAFESSAHRRQSLPFLPSLTPSDSAGSSTPSDSPSSSPSETNNPLNTHSNTSTNPSNSENPSSSPNQPLPQTQQSEPSSNSTSDSLNLTPSSAVVTTPLNLTSPPPPIPPINAAPTNSSAGVSSKQSTVPSTNSSAPAASPSHVSSINNTVSTPAAGTKIADNTTSLSAATTPTQVVTSDLGPNITTALSDSVHSTAASHRTFPTSTPPPQSDSSGGLSGGAITGIAIVGGIIGFILLFWVGVQLLQSKRRQREEAKMQEIDFYPSGGGSVNGGMAYTRNTGTLDRQPSDSNSFNYNKGGLGRFEPPYGDVTREEGEYIDPPTREEYEPALQRQATLGGSSAHSASYYNNPVPGPPAPYTNYSPYSHQFGMQPPQQMYDPRPYEYTIPRVPPMEYSHAHAPSIPPSSIEYQH